MEKNINIVTKIGIIIKRITGIKDLTAFRKEIKKKYGKIFYHKKYNADDLISIMKKMGMKKGSVVCIHAAMKEFYNYRGTAQELIEKILNVITPEGTLLMPAYPQRDYILDHNFIFDVRTTPTAAGYLAETFRKYPGVIRSINTQHSVCAIGKYANWLTKDHHRCRNCWDENSPWYRMTQLNALVFNLGIQSHYIGTFVHCVEGLLWKEHPYWNQFFNLTFTFKYRNKEGNIGTYSCYTSNIERRTHEMVLIKHLKAYMHKTKISNLLIQEYDTHECLKMMLDLGRKGITMYYVPSPKMYKF